MKANVNTGSDSTQKRTANRVDGKLEFEMKAKASSKQITSRRILRRQRKVLLLTCPTKTKLFSRA
jgi:hypothetical protein